MPQYRIKQDAAGFTPQYTTDNVTWTNITDPKPNATMAEWAIDNHAKGSQDLKETYRDYTPTNKIPLHD